MLSNLLSEVLSPISLGLSEGETSLSGLQLMPLGKWNHPNGKIEVTYDRAKSFSDGFQRRVAGQRLPLLWIHSDKGNVSNPLYGKAAGWITGMHADQSKGLLIDIEFTKQGAESVRNKEYAYLSAEYFDKVQLPHHSTPHKDVMIGAALVNRPHLKGMTPILNEETGHQFLRESAKNDDNKGGGPVDPILLQLAKAAGIELSEEATELTDDQRKTLESHLSDNKSELEKLEGVTKERDDAKARLVKLEDPTKAKAKSLHEAGFEDEAKLLEELAAEREIKRLGDMLPEGFVYSPTVKDKLTEYAASRDPKHLQEAFSLVVSGKGTVDLTEHGSSGGGKDDEDPGAEFNSLSEALAKSADITLAEAQDQIAEEKPELLEAHEASMRRVLVGGGQ